MGMLAKLSSPLVAMGGIAIVATVLTGGYFTVSSQVCQTDEPPTCDYFEENPGDKVLEKRGDDFKMKVKAYTASDVSDFRPEYAYTYTSCSSVTGTGLMHAGTPVTDPYCQALGCNYKQCVQKRVKCNKATGDVADDYKEGTNVQPDLFCVAAKHNSNITPAKFAAIIMAALISMTMCVMGCMVGPQEGTFAKVVPGN